MYKTIVVKRLSRSVMEFFSFWLCFSLLAVWFNVSLVLIVIELQCIVFLKIVNLFVYKSSLCLRYCNRSNVSVN